MSYAYMNTRVRAMKARLIDTVNYQKMLKMSITEIARFLEDHEYKREIDVLASKYESVDLIEHALNRNMSDNIRKIYKFSVRDSREKLSAYLKIWDVRNIKTVLRAKFAGISDEETLENLIIAGTFGKKFWERLMRETKTVEDVVSFFNNTEYEAPLSRGIELFKQTKALSRIENELDRYHFKEILSVSTGKLKKFMQMRIDALNIMGLLRLRKAGATKGFMFIPGGKLRVKQLVQLSAQQFEEIVNTLIEQELIIKGSLEEIEGDLVKRRAQFGYRMLRDHKLGIDPIMGYYFAKRIEIGNIRLLVRAKQAGFEEKEIEKMLVL